MIEESIEAAEEEKLRLKTKTKDCKIIVSYQERKEEVKKELEEKEENEREGGKLFEIGKGLLLEKQIFKKKISFERIPLRREFTKNSEGEVSKKKVVRITKKKGAEGRKDSAVREGVDSNNAKIIKVLKLSDQSNSHKQVEYVDSVANNKPSKKSPQQIDPQPKPYSALSPSLPLSSSSSSSSLSTKFSLSSSLSTSFVSSSSCSFSSSTTTTTTTSPPQPSSSSSSLSSSVEKAQVKCSSFRQVLENVATPPPRSGLQTDQYSRCPSTNNQPSTNSHPSNNKHIPNSCQPPAYIHSSIKNHPSKTKPPAATVIVKHLQQQPQQRLQQHQQQRLQQQQQHQQQQQKGWADKTHISSNFAKKLHCNNYLDNFNSFSHPFKHSPSTHNSNQQPSSSSIRSRLTNDHSANHPSFHASNLFPINPSNQLSSLSAIQPSNHQTIQSFNHPSKHPSNSSSNHTAIRPPIQTFSHSASHFMKKKRRRVITSEQRRAANVRERRRMSHLNEAFDGLKKRVRAHPPIGVFVSFLYSRGGV